ncbi:invasion associated locus B family protein [Rhizobiales bacterium Sp-1]|uniref:Invasion associated locus B family protein n=2 Tax=Segnochrobactrum spirostomi TaxID=2608987 RepID=A0A6A7Y7F8_9HYPH|nr:invasion associated locus B family protein [Segnochrobactrum spirostomi]
MLLAASAVVGALLVAQAQPAAAQTSNTTAAKKADAPSSLPGGASSLQESYDDWNVMCIEPDGQKRCVFSQTQVNQQNQQRVLAAELSTTSQDAARGVLAMPFGLALASGVTLQIDDAAPGAALPFQTCLPVGCIVQINFDAATIANLRKGKQLKLNAVAADTSKPVTFTLSLKGFGAALNRTAALSK